MALLLYLNLLERQIVDRDGNAVGKVDDLELRHTDDGPFVAALLGGQQALGGRFGGVLGRWISSTAVRLSDHEHPRENIAWTPFERPSESARQVSGRRRETGPGPVFAEASSALHKGDLRWT